MLAENQVKRLLKHCLNLRYKFETDEKINHKSSNEYHRTVGWTQALRLVLEKSTEPISNKPLEEEE
tara:strand:- start:748 stop:945 length:198 start_codon:yes stop_codon:yes gene_type:complete